MTRLVRVARKWEEAERIFVFELADAAGAPLPAFGAGSHIDVHICGGMTRQYSLIRHDTERERYEIAVQRELQSRGGSEALCASVREGDELLISEPRNHFALEPAQHTILLAGGIGITPLLCMAERLASTDASFELHYCAQTRSRAAFLNRIASSTFAGRAFCHFDDGADAQRLDIASALAAPRADKHVYVCGPAGFLEFVRERARLAGWANANVHFEYFAPPPDQDRTDSAGFAVVLASSGKTVVVGADEPVTAALARAGVDIPMSCESGVCGTCLTRVIEGIPDHRDYFLSDAERAANDRFLPCCSRAKSTRLVLDI
jgi:vanillate O-demethylase ferredoxin subunit